jgi:hypothetical protein
VTTDNPADPGAVSLSLSAPEAATMVAPAEAEREVSIDPEAAKRIDAMVATFIGGLRAIDVHGDDYRRRIDDVDSLADREIRTTSDMSNGLLDRPTRAMSGLGQGDTPIAKSLLDLRRSVEELNLARHDLTHGAQSHIEGIVGALREGGGELERDNAAIAQEQKALWSQMESLRQYAYMAEKLDSGLEAQINHVAIGDPERAKVLQEDILYPVRRRRQEILTQLAVAVQGYAALRVVEVNNRELVRAVRTATTTTVAALRTAEQAAGPGIDMGSLQRVWDTVFAALDQIDSYKLRALEAMKITVRDLSDQVERSRAQVDRLHSAEATPPRVPSSGQSLRLS